MASSCFADWFSKPQSISGLNLGDGLVSGVALVVFIVLVTYTAVTKYDVQPDDAHRVHPNRLPRLMTETE